MRREDKDRYYGYYYIADKATKTHRFIEAKTNSCVAEVYSELQRQYKIIYYMDVQNRFVVVHTFTKEPPYKKYSRYKLIESKTEVLNEEE